MDQKQNNSNALTILAAAVAGTVTVATSSGPHDFSDMVIGVILSILIWPIIKARKTKYWRLLASVVGGLCVLLVVGVFIDATVGKTTLHYSHLLIWALGSLGLYYYIPVIEKKQNITKQEESI